MGNLRRKPPMTIIFGIPQEIFLQFEISWATLGVVPQSNDPKKYFYE